MKNLVAVLIALTMMLMASQVWAGDVLLSELSKDVSISQAKSTTGVGAATTVVKPREKGSQRPGFTGKTIKP